MVELLPAIRDQAARSWLESEERFEAFRLRMTDRLRERRVARVDFLQRVIRTLDELIAEAQALRDEESQTELATCRSAAATELETLDQGGAGACSRTDGGTADLCRPMEDDPHGRREPSDLRTDPEVRAQAASIPEAEQPVLITAQRVEIEGPAAAVVEILEMPVGSVEPTGTVLEPSPSVVMRDAPPPVEGSPRLPERELPVWTPRERTVVEREVEELAAAIRALGPSDDTGLLRLKAIACRLRRAYQELEAQNVYLGDVMAAHGALKARNRDEYGDGYVVPLDTSILPADPAQWEELARAYEGLVPAVEAFAWFSQHERDLRRSEAEHLLEGIGAAQQRLFRLLEGVYRVGDDQQRDLYKGLLTCAEALSIFLKSLRPATSDAELAQLAGRLEKTYRDLHGSAAKRLAQETTLAALQTLLSEPSFGAREEDAGRLQAVAQACLEAGVPKTKPELCNTLLEWEALLEDAPGLEALRHEIAKEKERQAKKGRAVLEDEEERGGKRLAPDLEKLRRELLPLTRGKRCLFVGGHVREEHRQRIQDALELEALEWPETDRFDANPNEFAADVRRSDIVVLLIRFMRTGMKKASELCREQGKAVVRLPRGLNVARVVTNFHEQLVPRGTVC